MKNIDISILSQKPCLDVKARLTIQPLAPLSMVSELPGSYYKSLKYPSKKMVCGMFENILGWHFSPTLRTSIIKQIKELKGSVENYEPGSTYKPLLMDYFELVGIPQIFFDEICFYDDLWARSLTTRDTPLRHYKQCRHVNYAVIHEWESRLDEIEKNEEMMAEEKKEAKKVVSNQYINKFPFFHPVLPTKREYISMKNGSYIYDALFDKRMYLVLKEKLDKYNLAYLGNSEGWVNLELE